MKKVNTPDEVQQLDIEKMKNVVAIQSIKLTGAATEELAKVPNNLHDGLKKGVCKMLQAIIKKIQERGPLQTNLSETCPKCCLPKRVKFSTYAKFSEKLTFLTP